MSKSTLLDCYGRLQLEVAYVRKNSIAEKSGLRRGCVIVAINGQNIQDMEVIDVEEKFMFVPSDGILEFRVINPSSETITRQDTQENNKSYYCCRSLSDLRVDSGSFKKIFVGKKEWGSNLKTIMMILKFAGKIAPRSSKFMVISEYQHKHFLMIED